MNTVELVQFAMGNALGILGQVMADVTPEMADWTPPGTANPIGGLYWHTLSSADAVVFGWGAGQPPLYAREGWGERIVGAPPPEGDFHPAELFNATVDLAAAHEYATAVSGAIQAWLATLTPDDLDRTMETPIGELTIGQMLITFVVWHIDAHCGEISALKGCQGAKGYPF